MKDRNRPDGYFHVRETPCTSCIYRPDCILDVARLEAQITDACGFFDGFRACHHHSSDPKVCCRGFWNRHKDAFQAGQLAQRFGRVRASDSGDMELA